MDVLKFLAGIAQLLMQGGDYAIKAFAAYRETPEGAKEWLDVENALVEIGALPADHASGSAQSVPDWVFDQSEQGSQPQEGSSDVKVDDTSEPKPASVKGAGLPVIHRKPAGYTGGDK